MTDRVVGLDLSNLNLMGSLTHSLLDLKFLSYLDLSLNNFEDSHSKFLRFYDKSRRSESLFQIQ